MIISIAALSMEGGEKMSILTGMLDLLYKIVGSAVGVVTLCITVQKVKKARKSKTKRNASSDVPK